MISDTKVSKIQELLRSKDGSDRQLGETMIQAWRDNVEKVPLSFFEPGCCYRMVCLHGGMIYTDCGIFNTSKHWSSGEVLYFNHVSTAPVFYLDKVIEATKVEA